jgi:hypothetical protein
MSDEGPANRKRETGGKSSGISVFLMVDIPFLVIGMTSQKVLLIIGITFVLLGGAQTLEGMREG